MTHTIVNPAELHDPVPFGYSHLTEVPAGRLVFVAGQYGSGADGQVVSADFATQVRQAVANLGTALGAVGLGYRNVVRLGTYVVGHDAAKLETITGVLGEIWGERPPAQTLIGVAALALPEMAFEIDAVATG
ncbi:RidA family protein [Amycolatopsis aidingensis]|uniref:RidA family protein n=1 Tax=Amycolatopsis aidingensis TaxID=2842453 RepID=UPI001C0CB23B|nr:Rid family hydrolase [Amycolatopsis aidingensis]